jgi:L-asparaginase
VELDDDTLGFIVSDELNPAKARILLMLGLSKKYPRKRLQELFYSY